MNLCYQQLDQKLPFIKSENIIQMDVIHITRVKSSKVLGVVYETFPGQNSANKHCKNVTSGMVLLRNVRNFTIDIMIKMYRSLIQP